MNKDQVKGEAKDTAGKNECNNALPISSTQQFCGKPNSD
jgi:hypothetical protein